MLFEDCHRQSLLASEPLLEWHQHTKYCLALASPDLDLEERNYIITKEISQLNKNSKAILRHLTTLTVIISFDFHTALFIVTEADACQVQGSGRTAWIVAKPVWTSALSSPDPVESAQLLGA